MKDSDFLYRCYQVIENNIISKEYVEKLSKFKKLRMKWKQQK